MPSTAQGLPETRRAVPAITIPPRLPQRLLQRQPQLPSQRPQPLVPSVRDAQIDPSVAITASPSANRVIAMAREAMMSARADEARATSASGIGDRLTPGITIDLSRKNISSLPDEVIDIIKNGLERLRHPPYCW